MSASTPFSDEFLNPNIGREIHDFACQLWPINRSITGAGVRQTLDMIKAHVPTLVTRDIATGTQVFDWTVPQEWFVREAWIKTPDGRKICDFSENNLHLVGYSVAVNKTISKEEMENHLYSRPDLPDAIPYVTSYYKPRWGFCISDTERQQLPDGDYHVFVDADHFDGSLTYGEAFFEGETDDEILISTYVCHPSMANNEISGMAVSTFLARHVANMPSRRFSYRFVFVPETIGSIAFLSQNLNALKAKVKAGFNLTCIGDDRSYSFLPSREGNTISDRVARHVLGHIDSNTTHYEWLDRGSDERQYCAPGIDLPVASIMRTKYGVYPEYHTSLDDLEGVVTPAGLAGGFFATCRCVEALEHHCFPKVTVLGEPQMGRHGLYPTLSHGKASSDLRLMMNAISYADGKHSMLDIATRCKVPVWTLYEIFNLLEEKGLIVKNDNPKN